MITEQSNVLITFLVFSIITGSAVITHAAHNRFVRVVTPMTVTTTAVVSDVTTTAAPTTAATKVVTTAKKPTTTKAPEQVKYTEADAKRFKDEIEAYAVSKGYIIDRSLDADNSEWGAMEWGIGPGWPYETAMAKAKSEIDFHAQGSWNERINVVYFYAGNDWWTLLPYCM